MTSLSTQVKYPQSMELFRFCLRILEIRQAPQKLNDQHLGKVLSLNPSDTSHWKRGKKCIKQNTDLEKLSKHLNIEMDILQDLADGSIVFHQAMSDFNDLEPSVPPGVSDHIENDALPASWDTIENTAKYILSNKSKHTAPIDITKLFQQFPTIQLIPSKSIDGLATSSRIKPGYYLIRHNDTLFCPYTRLAITRHLCKILYQAQNELKISFMSLSSNITHDIMMLANAVLMPHDMLAREIAKTPTRINLVKSLGEVFCVPKSAVRKRLTALLTGTCAKDIN